MIRKLAILFVIMICVSGCASEGKDRPSATDIFYRAAGAYQSGDYDKAIELYEKLRSSGIESGVVYYNLGNAYLKTNEIGKAILSYTRSRGYLPRDSDLIANDRYAHTLMKQPDAKTRSSPLVQEVLRLFGIISLKESIGIFLVIYYLLAALIIYAAVRRRGLILIIVLALIVTASLIIAAIPVIDKIYSAERGAIIVSSVVDVKKEPYDEAPTGFPIYAGMKVYVIKEGLGWFKIQRPDGRIGWVPAKSIENIRWSA
ncbi:MAG: hypothetical protein NTZ95_07975 [Candidatus Omnitrophica bacterium]|nr:hypothetical protein [Candidatus Omnitrophota bacterium]